MLSLKLLTMEAVIVECESVAKTSSVGTLADVLSLPENPLEQAENSASKAVTAKNKASFFIIFHLAHPGGALLYKLHRE